MASGAGATQATPAAMENVAPAQTVCPCRNPHLRPCGGPSPPPSRRPVGDRPPAPLRCTAPQVGNQFVSQYYTVLHTSPKHLHRFYADHSTLIHADVIPEGGAVSQNLKTATGQKVRGNAAPPSRCIGVGSTVSL